MWCMNGDPGTHLKHVNYILQQSKISSDLFYPALHIYSAEFILLSRIPITTLHIFLPLIFESLYMPLMYIFSKLLFKNRNIILLSSLASSALILGGWYNFYTPNALSNMLFPLILICLLKKWESKDYRWSILIVILTFFIPIFHQVPTLAFLITLVSLPVPQIIAKHIKKDCCSFFTLTEIPKSSKPLILLIFVWGTAWVSSFYIWDYFIINLKTLIMEGGATSIDLIVDQANYAQYYGYNVIEQISKQYGAQLIYLILAFVSIPLIIKDESKTIYSDKLMSLYGPILSILLIILILFPLNLPFSPLRFISYIVTFSTPYVGYCSWKALRKYSSGSAKNRYVVVLISCIFIAIWINSIFTIYPSPYTLSSNYQTPMSEVKGMEWLFQNRMTAYEITGITIAPYRFGEFLLNESQRMAQNLHWVQPEYLKIPYHFGYNNKSSLYYSFNRTLYISINEKDRLTYKELFPRMASLRFKDDDFEMLNYDTNLYKIYANEGFETYYLDKEKSRS